MVSVSEIVGISISKISVIIILIIPNISLIE